MADQGMADQEFDWNDYLSFAQSLVAHISGEASARTSSSRAYYAAYWKARLVLEANSIVLPRSNIHNFVWDAFAQSWNEDGASIGKLGNTLKSFRVKADYYAFPPMTKADAEIAVVNAEDLVQDLDTLSDTAKAAAIQKATEMLGMAEYQSFRE